MITHHSILKSNAFEPKLRWMILLSFIVHFILLSLLIGKPSEKSKKVYFSPAYTVNLVNLPASSSSGNKGSFRSKKTSLWKGPAKTSSSIKTMSSRKHTLITIPKRNKTGIKGKKISPGTEKSITPSQVEENSPKGEDQQQTGTTGSTGKTGSVNPVNLKFNQYYTAVYNKIYNSWVLPGYGSKKQLEAVVNIRIAKNGKILNTSFEQRSSNAYFDRSVLRAIKKADPLPPLPSGFNEKYLELGIRFIPEG